MVLLALELDAPLPDGDNARHHTHAQPLAFKLRALFDMHFIETLMPAGFQLHARLARQARCRERITQRRAIIAAAAPVNFFFRQLANDGPTA